MSSSRVQGAWSTKNKKTPPVTTNLQPRKNAESKILFTETNEKIVLKPDDITIRKSGEYVLSTTTKGVSKIYYFANFLPVELADCFFARLLAELPWGKQTDDFGPHNRLTAWFGEFPYSYAGLTHTAFEKWHPTLKEIQGEIEKVTDGRTFNSVLCNLYRNNKDGVGWHSDDEEGLRNQPYIGSVSLGETRLFEMRQKVSTGFSTAQHVKIHLTHGSLLIMEGATQDDWQHSVPTEYHDRGARINLTYRTIYPSGVN